MKLRMTGRATVFAILLGAAAYIGLLLLFVEPTPWRDLPEEGIGRNGVAFDGAITEFRIYRMPTRRYPFYFQDELAPVHPLLRTGDPAAIERLLALLQPPEAGGVSACVPAKPEAGLHVVTYRADGSVFGYVVVLEAKPAIETPAGTAGCQTVLAGGRGGNSAWHIRGFFDALRALGVAL